MLKINNLYVKFKKNDIKIEIIQNLSFEVAKNSILGIVGESGSGKSITSLSILRLLAKNAEVSGEIFFEEENLLEFPEKKMQEVRGNQISMIFQEPMSSLNPSMRCGQQVEEILFRHKNLTKKEVKEEVLSLFEKVKLPNPEIIFKKYPHEISGGQKQRVMIAMAIACKPKLLIADEPTTALDVTVQKEIIDLLKSLQEEMQMSIIFITHDLELISEIADEIIVMQKGQIVEKNTPNEIFHHPKEDYTKALINSKPKLDVRLKTLPTVSDFIKNTFQKVIFTAKERKEKQEEIYNKKPILEVKNLKTYFQPKKSFLEKEFELIKAVDDVSFQLYEGETLGLVGESGCGKSTLSRTILKLEKATDGEILYKGVDITKLKRSSAKQFRKDIQLIFQDPFASLNPKMKVGEAIMEVMSVHNILKGRKERREYIFELLERVGLKREFYDRYPHEFSGGQRQRIGIARAIALQPKIIICDESVSALDVSVQAQVLNLLNELKEKYAFTYIFISHDLSVVKYMSDQLIVMNKGKIEEKADADKIYENPASEYTKKLIASIPKGI
ncbi:ABC transporter ATP-binding protein [Aureivirga sp. CE67]|uniref:ABC transporter ATP-binding protein n=1 Tax=Aureivirga sp. CE67 TaxID=1788983 RepID=UPI0018C9D395|nr:ABC transporter ATP-binding protein [Aureivirga sp. CE67]